MQPPSISDQHFHDATAPPPSVSSFDAPDGERQDWLSLDTCIRRDSKSIVRVAQDAVLHIDGKQAVQELPRPSVAASQYRNKLGLAVRAKLSPVFTGLEQGRLRVRIIISQDDTLSSIKKQISNHAAIFDQKGYPAWSKDMLGADIRYENHSWCQLVFRKALASTEQSMQSELMHIFNAYTYVRHALDLRKIEDLQDYIQVLKSLDQIYERVERYGMCSTKYQVTIRSVLSMHDRQTITAGSDGCSMSEPGANNFESHGKIVDEFVVWPPPASGRRLPRHPQIVKLEVAKGVAASKFCDLQLRDVEDLGLHKLVYDDLKLLLNTPRFANGAELLAQKFLLGNHVTDGFMSNLARHWLLGDAERHEDAFKHLLLLPDITSIDLVRMMMAAVGVGTADELRLLCWTISAEQEIWECCEAISSASVPAGIVARARLGIACLEPALLGTVQSATRSYGEGTAGREPADKGHGSEELKALLRFAKTESWKPTLIAYVHLKEIGATSYSVDLLAKDIRSDGEARKLEELIRQIQHSSMRREIVDASRSLRDLELYAAMLNGEQVFDGPRNVELLRRLLSAAGYRHVTRLHVPIEPGSEQQSAAAWMLSGASEGLCVFGEIFLRSSLEKRNRAPRRDDRLLNALTGKARLDPSGIWEFFQGFIEEKSESSFWMFTQKTTTRKAVWKNAFGIECTERSHAHLSEQIYFHMNGSELPDACGLSLVKLGRSGTGCLVGRGLTITPRIADDIWHLGGDMYYSMSRGRLWKMQNEGSAYYAGRVEKVAGRFIAMSRGGLAYMTIS